MNVAITGASGFIGQKLIDRLRSDHHSVRTLGRGPSAEFKWDALAEPAPAEALDGADAVVHLAGEPIAQRWNPEVKRRIAASRVTGTRNLVAGIAKAGKRPEVLVSASAIGYYGDTGESAVTESSPSAKNFLAGVTQGWETEAQGASELGLRVVRLRIGIVLGLEGGALAQMLTPFRFGVGGVLGSGKQWMSWIHVEDLVSLIAFALNHRAMCGAYNATAPVPVRNVDFTHELAAALHRPAVIPVPKFLLALRFGEAAPHLVESSRVIPRATLDSGFSFRYPEVGPALRSLVG